MNVEELLKQSTVEDAKDLIFNLKDLGLSNEQINQRVIKSSGKKLSQEEIKELLKETEK